MPATGTFERGTALDVDIGTLGTIVGVVVSIIAAAIWLGSIHARVSAQEARIVRLEEIAESMQRLAMTIQGDMKVIVATVEIIQDKICRRRPGGKDG